MFFSVSAAFSRGTWNDVSFETSEEISLLSSLLQMYDSCWEIKLRSLMKIFIQAVDRLRNPTSNESGLLPCLKIIQNFIRATQSGVRNIYLSSKLNIESLLLNVFKCYENRNQRNFPSCKWKAFMLISKLG